MEQAVIKYGKVLENAYSDNPNNYAGNSELTVTITLNEFRELTSCKATKDAEVEKLRLIGYEKDARISDLKSQNEKLFAMLTNTQSTDIEN